MRVIIAGSRHIQDYAEVEKAVAASGFKIDEVVCGCAPGIDTLGERWANEHGVPIKHFPADWDNLGKKAGPVRNWQMAQYADALILVWDLVSPGSTNMRDQARRRRLKIHEHAHVPL
jgi:hypothetical protein